MPISEAAAFFERVRETLVSGSSARTRIGTFYVETHPGYEGMNPRTGEVIPVAPKKVLSFVASDELTAAAFGPRTLKPHAEELAEMEKESAEAGATLAPFIEVACTDDELEACVRAVGAELAPDHRVEIAPLGELVLRQQVEGDKLRVQFRASDELYQTLSSSGR